MTIKSGEPVSFRERRIAVDEANFDRALHELIRAVRAEAKPPTDEQLDASERACLEVIRLHTKLARRVH